MMALPMKVPKLAFSGVVAAGMLLLLLQDVVYGFPITGTPGVGIQDYTGGDILVHCQSADTNFDPRVMHDKQIWRWNFKPNLGGSTLWSCAFTWGTQTASFPVWSIDVAPQYDSSINDWRVAPDGFYLYDTTKFQWRKELNWGVHMMAHNFVQVQQTGRAGKHLGGANGV